MLKYSQQGFTLIELSIVVAIIGLLVMIAFPSYQSSVVKSRRAEAKASLTALAQHQESYFVEHGNRYASSLLGAGGLLEKSPLGFIVEGDAVFSENKYYKLEVAEGAGTRYQLNAIPVGSQDEGERKLGLCHTLTLNSAGQKGLIMDNGITVTDKNKIKDCW